MLKIVADLFILASESGGGKLRSLSTACSYSTFPFAEDSKDMQSSFLMDLFTQLKESSSWKIALPALKPILQVAPAVWTLDRQKLEKSFALTELLKLQAITKTVELTSWSCEREQLRSFLTCLPYISHLRWVEMCDVSFGGVEGSSKNENSVIIYSPVWLYFVVRKLSYFEECWWPNRFS